MISAVIIFLAIALDGESQKSREIISFRPGEVACFDKEGKNISLLDGCNGYGNCYCINPTCPGLLGFLCYILRDELAALARPRRPPELSEGMRTCSDNEFKCKAKGRDCIPLEKLCDSYNDCDDYADEQNFNCEKYKNSGTGGPCVNRAVNLVFRILFSWTVSKIFV